MCASISLVKTAKITVNIRNKKTQSLGFQNGCRMGCSRLWADNRVGLLRRDGEAKRGGVTTAEMLASCGRVYAQIKSPLREFVPVLHISPGEPQVRLSQTALLQRRHAFHGFAFKKAEASGSVALSEILKYFSKFDQL